MSASPPAGRLARLPLRSQLIALLVATVALVVLVTSVASSLVLSGSLVGSIDADLREGAGLARHRRDQGDGDGPGRRGGHGGPRGQRSGAAVTLQLYSVDGTLQPDAAGDDGGPDVEDPSALVGDEPAEVGDLQDDTRWRVLATRFPSGSVVVAGVPLGTVDRTVTRLLAINAGVGVVALGGAGLLAGFAVRRSLRPLVDVERTAEAIAGGDLTVRVPAADPRTEVGSLAASFNVMVDRFESAYSAQQRSELEARVSEGRMRRFVADASHELRTPLTSIRGFAELFRQSAAREPEQLSRVMRRIEDEAARMGLLVQDLLLLARLDQARPLGQEPVDLLGVAADVVHPAATVQGATHAVHLAADTEAGLPVVVGDDARLHQVVTNLVGNAVSHTPAGTRVDVVVRRSGDEVVVEVRDDGPGMPPDVAARVFERFYRADASRTRGATPSTGSGLGLSIVAAIVAAHGGSVSVDSRPGSGSSFMLRLPAAARA